MNQFLQDHLFDIFLSFGFVVYVVAQWWSGRQDAKTSLETAEDRAIKVANERAELYEKRLKEVEKEWQEKFNKEHDRVTLIEGQFELKKEEAERYLKILENRNPEIENLLREVSISLKNSSEAINSMRLSFDALTKSNELMMKNASTTKVEITHPQ